MKILKIMAIGMATIVMGACAHASDSNNSNESYAEAQLQMNEGESNVKLPSSDSQFRPGMTVNKPTVIDFNATWCGPCRMLTPAFDLAAASYANKVDFYSVDVDKYPSTSNAFRISAIPYVLLVSPDGTTKEFVGLTDFVEGLDPNSNPTEDEITQVIYSNLSKQINLMLGK